MSRLLQQSQLDKSNPFNSEFRTSMLKRLNSLQSPGFDYSVSSSTLLCNSPSNVSNSTTASSRRRRFYQSPGLTDELSRSVPRKGSPCPQIKTLGTVLEERAKLVKRTLTGNSRVGRTCSTPMRSSLIVCEPLNDGATATETYMHNVLTDLSNITDPPGNFITSSNQTTASDPTPVTLFTPKPKRQKYHSQVIYEHKKRSRTPAKLRPQSRSHRNATSSVVDIDPEDVKLERFSFRRDKCRQSREFLWMQLTCTLIKNLVHREPLRSDDIFKCRCLQMALRATKVVDPIAGDLWLSQFSERVVELIQDVEKCSFHTRIARPHSRIKKLNVERAEAKFSDELWTDLLAWLRSARSHLLERLTRNIQLFA